ncbi:hypothetical protein [Methanosarcina sp. 2.H.A.1B.4]|uniref:hypothetical protein n=1 Tax=Methanosarcina sp. 2.H.A.1B.4 TaxID=1483600 RepID=UPI000621FE46|nr:hypothetical protein [Methanosarcina sp. 2.H.A.1B.4]KKG13062.1 hypothetical protein EO92_07800 [Methanosarcina sp. 2.H.A.1B.4]
MTDSSDFYSTIASITGVWISILIPFGITFYIYIWDKNMDYFKSVRSEKINFYLSVTSLVDELNIQFRRHTDINCKDKLYETLKSVDSMCDQQNKNRDELSLNMEEVCGMVKVIFRCYPHPIELGHEFLFTNKLPHKDEKYKLWVEKYRDIEFRKIDKTFDKLYDIFAYYLNTSPTTNQNELDADTKSKILKLKTVMKKLRTIDISINEIERLIKDYEPLDDVLKAITSKSVKLYIMGTIIFGIVLPLYMLLPEQFVGLTSEFWMIAIIVIGFSVCLSITLRDIFKISKLLIRE